MGSGFDAQIMNRSLVKIAGGFVICINISFWVQLSLLLGERPLLFDISHGYIYPIPHNGLMTFVTRAEGFRLNALMIGSGASLFAFVAWTLLLHRKKLKH